jgi:glycosyltransferase involved in cell wall biosynthesis
MSAANALFLTILMPCLNEAKTLPLCVKKARAFLARQNYAGEIIVADNGSTDGSREIATELGARVVPVSERGYGNALRAGIVAARGQYVIMGDSDDSYDFLHLDGFVEKLEQGADLVVGNRFWGGIEKGAMPPLHRYFGNPLLTQIGRTLYRSPVGDFYCGLRGFRRDAILKLDLVSPGMEFALEMVVKASINHLRITEVPTTLSPDGRGRPPHLRSWRDGWRSLRFFLLLSPRGLFLYPGMALAILGGLLSSVLIFTDIHVGRISFSFHTLVLSSTLTVIGINSVAFWIFSKIVGTQKGLLAPDPQFERRRAIFSLERCVVAGGALAVTGLAVSLYAVLFWSQLSFGAIPGDTIIRTICAASFLLAIGFETLFAAFFIYLLDQRPRMVINDESSPALGRRIAGEAAIEKTLL